MYIYIYIHSLPKNKKGAVDFRSFPKMGDFQNQTQTEDERTSDYRQSIDHTRLVIYRQKEYPWLDY